MVKAYLFETYGGLIHRCMFAGLDSNGLAKWVNITPDESVVTITCETAEDLLNVEDKNQYMLIAMEGEAAQPCVIVQALKRLGVTWLKEPLELNVRVLENGNSKIRHGKYSFWVEDKNRILAILADVDGFNDLDELLSWIRTYFETIEKVAEIPITTKTMTIDGCLKKDVSKGDLAMFDMVKVEK